MSKLNTDENVFNVLSKIPIKHLVEKKGGLNYLSWSHAWGLMKTHYPNSSRKIYENEHTGLNYFTDGNTSYVKVGVTINGEEIIDMLPRFDFRLKAVTVDKMTSVYVNKTIQRSTVKALAMFGLGISLYNGEDIPAEVKKAAVKPSLELNTAAYSKALSYVQANASKGAEALLTQLRGKYSISDKVANTIKVSIVA